MAIRQVILATMGSAMLVLAACSGPDEPILMHAGSESRSPDEFGIVPNRPLEMPDSLAELPTPNPGGVNRVEPQPRADVARALGGSAEAATAPGAVDGGIVNHASRFGRDQGIREELAAADLEHRRRNRGRVLERVFSVNVYHDAYRSMWLDQRAEQDRWRRAGVRTPSAPPPAD